MADEANNSGMLFGVWLVLGLAFVYFLSGGTIATFSKREMEAEYNSGRYPW